MTSPASTPARVTSPSPAAQTPHWSTDAFHLLLTCRDEPGIIAHVTNYLVRLQANITELQQFTTGHRGGHLFMRIEFSVSRPGLDVGHIADELRRVFGTFSDMTLRLVPAATRKRLAVFVSKADHALREILWRCQSGDIQGDVVMVVSNHQTLSGIAREFDVPFNYVPVSSRDPVAVERKQLDLLRGKVDTIVLARYMQILTASFLAEYPDNIINIHHSFLPAFAGANPYQQALDRGVKLVGATAHYATEQLDAGPIIEQNVIRVDHRHSLDDLRRMGRLVERDVLANAVAWHAADRLIVHGNRTITLV